MISRRTLNDQFIVMAKLEYRRLEVSHVLTRPEARIIRKGVTIPEDLSNRRADALIVLLSPGECKPKGELREGWQESIPDQTQFQLMRLMDRMDWDELIMVNLSDMCEGDFFEFQRLLKICELLNVPNSYFSNNINAFIEMTELVDYVLYGWGSKPQAKKLALEHGFLPLGGLKLKGKEPKAFWHEERGYPRHPFPYLPNKCEEWLEEMIAVLSLPSVQNLEDASDVHSVKR